MSENAKKPSVRFKIVDTIYIVMMILPLAFGIVLDILSTPPSSGVDIAGARIYHEISLGGSRFFNIIISEAQVNSILVLITIFFVFLYFRGEAFKPYDIRVVFVKVCTVLRHNLTTVLFLHYVM